MTKSPWTETAVLCAVIALGTCSCGSSEQGGSDMIGSGRVGLRGRIPVSATPLIPGAIVSRLGPPDAVKVIVTSGEHFEVGSVVDGAFSFMVPPDRPAGLVLVGPADEYLGFVTVRGSIPGVPMQATDEGVSTIDLGTLVTSGAVIAPGVDPIGNGISLDDAQIEALSELGVFARMLLADPDVDDDGAIDLLQDREYRLQISAFRQATFNGLEGGMAGPIDWWSMGVNVVDFGAETYPPVATATGPAGSGVDALPCTGILGGFQNILYRVPLQSPSQQPTPGTWTLTFGARTLAFEIGDLTAFAQTAPALEPTVVLNPDQTLERIDWRWRMADGSFSSEGAIFAVDVRVQILADPPAVHCAASNLGMMATDQVYAMRIPADTNSHRLACQDIPWSAVTSVELTYTDVFSGTHTVITRRF